MLHELNGREVLTICSSGLQVSCKEHRDASTGVTLSERYRAIAEPMHRHLTKCRLTYAHSLNDSAAIE